MYNLEKRLEYHHSAIMYDEKFETWLNLNPLIELQKSIKGLSQWPLTPIYVENSQLLGYRSLQGMRDARVTVQHIVDAKVTPLLPSLVMHDVFNFRGSSSYKRSKAVVDMFRVCADATLSSVNHQVAHLLSSMPTTGPQWNRENTSVWKSKLTHLPSEFIEAYQSYELILNVLNEHKRLSGMARKDSDYKSYIKKSIPFLSSHVVITPDLILWEYHKIPHLLNRSAFLELFNKISELQALILYAWLQTGTSLKDSHYFNCMTFWKHIIGFVQDFYNPYERHDLKTENLGFTYLKSIEGLGVSELIRRGDEGWNWINDKLGETLWKAMYEAKIVKTEFFRESELRNVFNACDMETIAEIIGTVKIVGHPSIDIEEGLESLYEKTHKYLPIDTKTRDSCVGTLTRDIIKVFYNKYGVYPNVTVDAGADSRLLVLFDKKIPFNSPEGKKLVGELFPKDWALVRFEKNDEFEVMDNRLAMLKDKALGLTRSKVALNWLSQQRVKRDIVDSKALLHFLFGNVDDMTLRKYFEEFSKDEWSDALLDYLVIKLTAKELELKIQGRFFGASPAMERDRRIVMESNVMRFMHNLIPDQLLTPNELEIVKKLVSFRDFRNVYPNCKIINISFDFSAWNNSMRSDVVDVGAGRILDPWYNTSIYNKTMKAYQNMLIYYDDGIKKRKWEGQEGGIEGLNQATWSIVFIGGIKYALESLGFKYSITVKGDDVRAAVIVPNNMIEQEGFDKFRIRIMDSIQKLCRAMGWSLNPNESFVSLSLIATSKQYLMNNTWLPSSMKKIMKINSHTNGIFTSLEDIIATIFSIAHSACSQTTVVMPAFVCASLIASTVFYRQLSLNKRYQQHITTLLMWPQILAGPGPLPLQTFFVRGENDMLSVIISLYQHIINNSKDIHLIALVQSILAIPLSSTPNNKMILGDPYCIDLQAPDRPESVLKRQIKTILKKRVVQPDIKELLNNRSEELSELLAKILRSSRPYYAKVATALWESSPFYLVEELLSKFTHSATVTGFLSQMRSMNTMSKLGQRLWKRVIDASSNRWYFWERVLTAKYTKDDILFTVHIPGWLTQCPTKVTNIIRSAQWGEVAGLTYPSLITQNWVIPEIHLDQYKPEYGLIPTGTFSTIKVNHLSCSFETPSQTHHYAHSTDSKLWLGATTSQKLEYTNIPEATQSPVLRKLKLLLALRKSTDSIGPSIAPIVEKLIESYTDIPLEDLDLLTPLNVMGHWAHRIPINSFSLNTMPNCRPNLSQLIHINNETHELMKGDKTGRTINMAARQFFLNVLVTFPLQYSNLLSPLHPTSYLTLFHHDSSSQMGYQMCPYCCADVDDQIIEFPDVDHLDLTMFRSLPLVSCGQFETQALRLAITNLVRENQYLQHLPRIQDLDKLTAANWGLRMLISQHIQSSLDLNSIIREEQMILNLQHPDMIDNVLTSNGKTPLSHKLVSLHVWRSVSPNMLYTALVQEAYIVFLSRVIPAILDQHATVASTIIPAVCYNALSIFLSRITNISGLSFLNEGLKHVGHIKDPIPWWFYLSDTHTLSLMFYIHHWDLFMGWYNDPGSCPYQDSVMMFSTDTSLKQGLKSRHSYVFNAFMTYLRRKHGLTWTVIKHTILRGELNTDDINSPSLYCRNVVDYIMECIIAEQVLGQQWANEERIEAMVARIITRVNLMELNIDFNIQVLSGTMFLGSVSTVEDYPHHFITSLTWTSLMNHVGNTTPHLDRIIGSYHIFACHGALEALDDKKRYVEESIIDFTRRYSLLTSLFLYKGSSIDCEREIKDYISVNVVDISDQPIYSRLPSHMRHTQLRRSEMVGPTDILCPLRHAEYGRHKDLQLPVTEADIQNASLWMEDCIILTQFLSQNQHQAFIDGVDSTRIFGNLNKAYIRWVDILNQTKIHWSNILYKTSVAVVGDGGGSVSRHILQTYPDTNVIFCDKHGSLGPGSVVNRMEAPVEFLSNCDPEMQLRLYGRDLVTGDVTLESTWRGMKNQQASLGLPCKLVISDAVPDDLRDAHWDVVNIVIGVIRMGYLICEEGGIILIRLPLLSSVHWGIIILQLLTSLTHVHWFHSRFDRPELLSVYVMIVKVTKGYGCRPDIHQIFHSDHSNIGIDNWQLSSLRVLLNEITHQKTRILTNPDNITRSSLRDDFSFLLRKEPITPLNNLFKDWTGNIHINKNHLCEALSQISDQLSQRLNVMYLFIAGGKPPSFISASSFSDVLEEILIGKAMELVVNRVLSNRHWANGTIHELYNRAARYMITCIDQCNMTDEEFDRFNHDRHMNMKLPIKTYSHIIRLLSWFASQYYVRTLRSDSTHPWFVDTIDAHLCRTCNSIFPHIPGLVGIKSPSAPDIIQFLYSQIM